ncbi:MAG: hypothetical protein ACXWUL_03845, partial [Caldimonas sp.]
MLASAALRPPLPLGARLARRLPSLVELAFVVAAIVAVLPLFDRVAALDPGRDQRFLDRGLAVDGLPAPVLAATCDAVAALATPELAAALCDPRGAKPAARLSGALPAPLATAIARAREAFVRP